MTGRRDAQGKPTQDPNTSSTEHVRDATAPPPPKLIVDGHVPPADGSNPAFFYSHTDVTAPLALAGREARRAVWWLWMDNLPGPGEQLENYAARMSAATGESHFTIKDSYIPGLGSLREKLPRLVALQEMLAHVSMVSLRKIGERVSIIDSPEALARIDAGITDFLTPTAPRQSIPTTRQITKKINELINLFDPEVFLDDDTMVDEDPVAPGAFGIDDRKPGVTEFYLTLPKDMGQLLMKKVDAYAFHYDCSRATAFHELLAKSGAPRSSTASRTRQAGRRRWTTSRGSPSAGTISRPRDTCATWRTRRPGSPCGGPTRDTGRSACRRARSARRARASPARSASTAPRRPPAGARRPRPPGTAATWSWATTPWLPRRSDGRRHRCRRSPTFGGRDVCDIRAHRRGQA